MISWRIVVLGLVAVLVSLAGEYLFAEAVASWVGAVFAPSSWVVLFLAAGAYYALLSPVSLGIASLASRSLAKRMLVAGLYVYTLFYLTAFALYVLGLAGFYAGIAPGLVLVLGSYMAALVPLSMVYAEKARAEMAEHSYARGVLEAGGVLFLAWLIWLNAVAVLDSLGLNRLVVYDPGLQLYIIGAGDPVLRGPLLVTRVTLSTLLSRWLAFIFLAYILERLGASTQYSQPAAYP